MHPTYIHLCVDRGGFNQHVFTCPCCCCQAHSCFQKAVMIVGLQHYRKLPATSETQFAVQPKLLAEAVAADLQQGLIPFYFLGTVGARCCWRLGRCCLGCFSS